MAVVPMQKVRLVVYAADVDIALDTIQRAGALEFRETNIAEGEVSNVIFPNTHLLPRVQHAVQFLEPYAPKVGLWKTLREGVQTELSESDIAQQLKNVDVTASIVNDLETLQVEFADVNEKVRTLEEQKILLSGWSALPIRLSQLETSYTSTLLVTSHQATEIKPLGDAVEEACVEHGVPCVVTEVSFGAVAVTIPSDPDYREKAQKFFEAIGAEVIVPPTGVETPEIELVAASEKLAAARGELALLYDQAEHFAITHLKKLQVVSEVLTWQRDRFAVAEAATATKYTVVFDGWLNQEKRSRIEQEFASRGIAAAFAKLELDTDEEPPVDIVNSPFVQPFEAVTRLYGMPGYKDLDPTVFLAGFFFLFFGLSLTDVGYGLFLMVVSALILTVLKVAPAIRLFAKLLLFVGFSTVLVGMLFGGYLGIPTEYIPEFLKKLQMYDPIGDPLPVFYTALGLGVVQVMAGMVLKIYSEYRNQRLREGVLDQGPWLLMFVLGITYLATSLEYVSVLTLEQIINLIYVGVVLIVVTSGRRGKTVLEKIRNAALSLYDSIGYFSDILSYSRLLALGLATTALAFAVNMIAGMVFDKDSYLSYILAGVILIIGHLFTLAVNTLGAFIHSARLQFVEFFGKFITGTGKEFSPLVRSQKHVTVIDD